MPRTKAQPKTEVDPKILVRGDFDNKMSRTQAEASVEIGNQVRTFVKEWAKVEKSQCWDIAKAINQGIRERGIKEDFWKDVLKISFEKEFGEGASKERSGTITKILLIGRHATDTHFKRWELDEISFEKASQEFTKAALSAEKEVKKQEGWVDPNLGSEEDCLRKNREIAAMTQKVIEERKKISKEGKQPQSQPQPKPNHDPNPVYATHVKEDPTLLPKLISTLITDKIFMPTKSLIEALCQSEEFKELISIHINEHPQEFNIE